MSHELGTKATRGAAPPRTYFDLLKEKYPEGAPGVTRSSESFSSGLDMGSRSLLAATLIALLATVGLTLTLKPRSSSSPPVKISSVENHARAPHTPLIVPSRPLRERPETAGAPREISGVAARKMPAPRADESELDTVGERSRAAAPDLAVARREASPATPVTASELPRAPGDDNSDEPSQAIADARPDEKPGHTSYAPRPTYPEAARRAGVEGAVVAEASVDHAGAVTGVEVIQSPAPELDRAVVETLRQWRFKPAIHNGRPFAYRYRQEFRFALNRPRDTDEPVIDGEPIEPPRRLVTPLPGYTRDAWAAGIQGEVLVRASIDTEGSVTGVEVVQGLPHGLTEAVVTAVRRWRFQPARQAGEPVAVDHNLSIRFAL